MAQARKRKFAIATTTLSTKTAVCCCHWNIMWNISERTGEQLEGRGHQAEVSRGKNGDDRKVQGAGEEAQRNARFSGLRL